MSSSAERGFKLSASMLRGESASPSRDGNAVSSTADSLQDVGLSLVSGSQKNGLVRTRHQVRAVATTQAEQQGSAVSTNTVLQFPLRKSQGSEVPTVPGNVPPGEASDGKSGKSERQHRSSISTRTRVAAAASAFTALSLLTACGSDSIHIPAPLESSLHQAGQDVKKAANRAQQDGGKLWHGLQNGTHVEGPQLRREFNHSRRQALDNARKTWERLHETPSPRPTKS